MGCNTPNPAVLRFLFISTILLVLVNGSAIPPVFPVVCPAGSGSMSNIVPCSDSPTNPYPTPNTAAVDAPNTLALTSNPATTSSSVTSGSLTMNGGRLTVRNVLPFQVYQFTLQGGCSGISNLYIRAYHTDDSVSGNFISEINTGTSCSSCTYGSANSVFSIKTNNAAIRNIIIEFIDNPPLCQIDNTPTYYQFQSKTVTVSLGPSCNSGSQANGVFEPNAVYNSVTGVVANAFRDDGIFANNFFGCPFTYSFSNTITWQFDGSSPGHQGVSIRFYDFNLRNEDEFVKIYHGAYVTPTSLAYTFTGRLPPGQEEVYLEDTIVTVQLITTVNPSSADPTTFTGFVGVFNWDSPCKVNTISPTSYVSYLPFDHLGCVGGLPVGLDTNFYYFPLNIYSSGARGIEWVFTNFDLATSGYVNTYQIVFPTIGQAFTDPVPGNNYLDQFLGTTYVNSLTIPNSNVLPGDGTFMLFKLFSGNGPSTGYGAAMDVGFSYDGLADDLCTLMTFNNNVQRRKFVFGYDTPSQSDQITCSSVTINYSGTVFYLIRPSSSVSGSTITFSINYNFPATKLYIYDGPSVQSPQIVALIGSSGTYGGVSTNAEILLVFETLCPAGSCSFNFDFSYSIPNDICHTSGKSVNQFPLATIGCPQGIPAGLESYWLISGEQLITRNVNQVGIITISFTFFDIGTNNFLNVFDGDSIYNYINDINPTTNLNNIGRFNGNTLPPAFETTQPELLLQLISSQSSFGFIAVYTIYNGQNPCINSAAITLYSPTGNIFCENAQDSGAGQTVSRWFINPNDGIVNLGVNYFYYPNGADNAVDATLAFFAGSEDTDPQLGIITPVVGNYNYYDPYTGGNSPSTFNYKANVILVKFLSASNPTYFSMKYATTAIQCSSSGLTLFNQQEGTFGCAGLSADARKTYTISPITQGDSITLDFIYFRLQKGEVFFKIYEGTSAAGTLKYTFTGHTIPPQIVIRSKSLFIDVDTSRTTSVSGGFEVHYYVQSFCTVSKDIKVTAPTNNIACLPFREGVTSTVLIEPNLGPITFSWNILNFQGVWSLYDGSTINSTLLASGYGTSLSSIFPPGSYTSQNRALLLVIINQSQQGLGNSAPLPSFGFSFTYTTVKRTDYPENQESEAISIFEDNSSMTYGSNAWLAGVTTEYYIAPPSHGRINLQIVQLTLQTDDVIAIYDGPSQEYPLLLPLITTSGVVAVPKSDAESILIIVSIAKSSVNSVFQFTFTSDPNPCATTRTVTLDQKFGFFGCPNGVANSVSSTWTVVPNNGPVVLEFLFLSFEKDIDFLSVYDGYAASSGILLATYTGYNLTVVPTFTSTLDAFTVTVDTSPTVLSHGFFAKWSTTDPCFIANSNTVLTDQAGTFGCVQGVADNLRSTWLIAPNNGTISLSFEVLNLNSVLVSGYYPNNITVYDGSDTTGPILAVITGKIPPPSVLSSQNSIFVVLNTGNTGGSRNMGFIAEYFALGITDPCNSNQALILTSSVGIIQCNPFKSGVESSWFITPLDGPLTFYPTPGFGSENFISDFLGDDTLTFYDGYSQTDPVLIVINNANENTVNSFTSTSQVVLVVLSARSSNVIGTGRFSYTYESQSSPCYKSQTVTYTGLSGTISCSNIGNNVDSSYVINPTGANGPITIEFSSFNLAPGDYLTIIEGTLSTGSVSATYTGTSIPPNYISSSAAVTIRVRTDSATRSIGFSLNYLASSDPCSLSTAIVYTDVTRTFGCTSVAASVTSSWLITPGFGNTIDLALLSLSPVLSAGTVVTVYGGSSVSGTPILTLDSTKPATPATYFNQDTGFTSLFVTLTSTGGGGGFQFLYASGDNDVCLVSGNTVLQQESGTFGCFHQIDNNLRSSWLIAPTSQTPITLDITLGTPWDNTFDRIRVFDGPTVSSTLLGTLDTYSGTSQRFTSSGGVLLVTLVTDGDTRSAGFVATYTASPTTVASACTISKTLPTQNTDGNFICGPLGNNVTSRIPISSGSGRILFTPVDILTEKNQDFVIIYDGTDPLTAPELARYSGAIQNGPSVVSSTSSALIVISTDLQNPSQLVNIAYVAATADPCILPGSITYSNTVGRFGCSEIVPPVGTSFTSRFVIAPSPTDSQQRVYLQFEDLYIPPGFGSITVYDGTDTTSSGVILATATGFNLPSPVTSTQQQLTLVLSVSATSSFFVSYAQVTNSISGPVVSISASPQFSRALTSVAAPLGGDNPSPTVLPSSTTTAAPRETSRSPNPDPSFATIPSFQPFVEPSSTPSTSFTATKSSTPSISLSYTETRTATATPAATPSATRASEFFNIRTRFNCNQTVEQCCTDFSSFWASLSVLNSQLLVAPKICEAITDRDILVEVVYEQFGSNFHTVNAILDDYWAKAGCGNQDPLSDGVCVPSTSSLASADWDDVYLLEVVEEAQYTTDLNTSAAVETTYNPIDSTYQPVFTSAGVSIYSVSFLLIVLTFFF